MTESTLTSQPTTPRRQGMRIGQLWVDALTAPDALREIERLVEARRGGAVFTPNVDHVVQAESNPALRAAYESASLSVPDGMPLIWLSKLLGGPLRERVAGSDLFVPLMRTAAQRGWRVYLFGGTADVAPLAAAILRDQFGVAVVGWSAPIVGADGVAADASCLHSIRDAVPDLVIVALGNPKQELWTVRHSEVLGPGVALCFGAVLDFLVGRQKRAPQWMIVAGFEWLHRLGQEPRRLWKRYLVRDPQFLLVAFATWRRFRMQAAGPQTAVPSVADLP